MGEDDGSWFGYEVVDQEKERAALAENPELKEIYSKLASDERLVVDDLIDHLGTVEEYVTELTPDWIIYLAKRLHAGQLEHGVLNLLEDKRSWHLECVDELADADVYTAFIRVAARLKEEKNNGK